MREHTIDRVTSKDVAIFVVWQPVLPTDNPQSALQHAAAEKDARVKHYFDTGSRLGRAYAAPLATPFDVGGPMAWDVVLLFDRGTRWKSEPPKPALYRFPMDLPSGVPKWDPAAFANEVRTHLP